MDSPTDSPFTAILAHCRDQLELLAESLNITCERQFQLTAGDSLPLPDLLQRPELDQPGLVVAIEVDEGVLLAPIPESLPLPDWYTHPDMEQKSRLGTLAMEWSMNCLPPEIAANGFSTEAVPNLRAALQGVQPAPEGLGLGVLGTSSDAAPTLIFWIAGPFAAVPKLGLAEPAAAVAVGGPETSTAATAFTANPLPDRRQKPAIAPADSGVAPLNRLLKIRVKLIVQLAEKKIELSQLMALGPGAIVTFEKSCEDLLDLYVNNQLFCRGEAVKIGEKFGLKISEVGAKPKKQSRVLGLAR